MDLVGGGGVGGGGGRPRVVVVVAVLGVAETIFPAFRLSCCYCTSCSQSYQILPDCG